MRLELHKAQRQYEQIKKQVRNSTEQITRLERVAKVTSSFFSSSLSFVSLFPPLSPLFCSVFLVLLG